MQARELIEGMWVAGAVMLSAGCAAALPPTAVPPTAALPPTAAQPHAAPPEAVEVRVDAAEAEAVLAALAEKRQRGEVGETGWRRIFTTEAYRRLEQREATLGRPFEQAAFRDFVGSAELAARETELGAALAAWRRADLQQAGRRALAYLPAGAAIRATVYLVIKPRGNSFVFDLRENPAIFLALDPAVPPAKLENTVAHELHHVGYAGACPPPGVEEALAELPAPRRRALDWLGAFGEGFAMLAAAGGPEVHPHAVSPGADRARWDAELARAPEQTAEVAGFLRAVLAGELDESEAQERGMSFFGIQGPWYTVGWLMAVTIERALGRDALIAAMCDRRELLPTYQRALATLPAARRETLPSWPAELTTALSGKPVAPPPEAGTSPAKPAEAPPSP